MRPLSPYALLIQKLMQTIEESQITQKTKELCQAILDQPGMQSIRKRIDAFMGDDKTRTQYDDLMSKAQLLQEKQRAALTISPEEESGFEADREALLKNPVARGFLDAQEELHDVQQSIHKYVDKTLELGRMPTEEDLNGGGCGHGCGCHH